MESNYKPQPVQLSLDFFPILERGDRVRHVQGWKGTVYWICESDWAIILPDSNPCSGRMFRKSEITKIQKSKNTEIQNG